MKKITIEIPSIRDDESGYSYLFKLANKIISDPYNHFDLSFKNCAILEQNAVTMLGGLATYVDSKNTTANNTLGGLMIPKCGVMFMVDSMSSLISSHLIENNFLSYFSKENFPGYPTGDYIGYRQHTDYLDVNELALHLHNEWLTDEKLSIAPDLKKAIMSRILEIFMNAYGHGVQQIKEKGLGVISCGQYNKKAGNKKTGELKLTVLDFGSGIIETVKSLIDPDMKDTEAMNWALTIGNSTRTDSIDKQIPRGLGFGLLREFVSLNQGNLSVFSNTCCAHVNNMGNYDVSEMKTPFSGTMVNISINCDDRVYKFISTDLLDEDQFF